MQSWAVDVDNGTAVVTYVGARDSLSFASVTELADLVEGFAAATSYVSLVLLTGAADQFIPDVDRAELERVATPEPILGDVLAWHRVTSALASLPQPAVAAIDGSAAGGACILALACSLRFASERATIGPVELNAGAVGTDTSFHLVRLVGPAVAADLLMSGRTLRADAALQLGLVNYVFPNDGFPGHVRGWCNEVVRDRGWLLPIIKQAVAHWPCSAEHERPEFATSPVRRPTTRDRGCNC